MFRPYANVREHNLIERSFLDSARANHLPTTLIECNRDLLPFCFNMYTHGLDFNSSINSRTSFCNTCKYQAGIYRLFSGYQTISLSDILPELNLETVRELDDVFKSKSPKFIQQGFDFCQMASYELRLRNASHVEVPEYLYDEWRRQTELCIRTFHGAQEFFRKKDTLMVVAYNRLYSLNNAFLTAAESMGHYAAGIQANGRPSKIYDRITVSFHRDHPLNPTELHSWKLAQSKPLTPCQVSRTFLALKDYLLSNGGWTFSPAISVSGKKTIDNLMKPYANGLVVLTLSSSDEMFAAHSAGVRLTWINSESFLQTQQLAINKYVTLANNNPNTLFVIRPHPRDCGNKRGTRGVEGFSETLRTLLSTVPESTSNIYLNTPSDGISIYDLIKVAKFVFNVNSTTGVHNTALGGTTIDSSDRTILSYPMKINRKMDSFDPAELTTPKQLFAFETVVLSWRWIHFQHYGNSINTNSAANWLFRKITIPLQHIQKRTQRRQKLFRYFFWSLLLINKKSKIFHSRYIFRKTEQLFVTNLRLETPKELTRHPSQFKIREAIERLCISSALYLLRFKE